MPATPQKRAYGPEVMKAINAVQKDLEPIVKGASNPFFKSKYATINQIWAELFPLLGKHGLMVSQPEVAWDGHPAINTVVHHLESGQCLESLSLLTVEKPGPQAKGAAITYTRRYALVSIFMIPTVDDDAEAAEFRPESPDKTGGAIQEGPGDQDKQTDSAAQIQSIKEKCSQTRDWIKAQNDLGKLEAAHDRIMALADTAPTYQKVKIKGEYGMRVGQLKDIQDKA